MILMRELPSWRSSRLCRLASRTGCCLTSLRSGFDVHRVGLDPTVAVPFASIEFCCELFVERVGEDTEGLRYHT